MNTLWTFGDSFTEGTGCGIDDEYHKNYFKEGDKIWPVWLSKLLNTNLKNYGFGGYSNDMILDSIIDNWKYINKGDIVFIGFTYSHRFDVPVNGELRSIVHNFSVNPFSSSKKEQYETIVNFQYHFSDNILYKNRQIKRFEWIKKLLIQKGCEKVILWNVQTDLKSLETIKDATKGAIVDYHLSFKSHKLLSEIFYKKYFEPELI